MQIRAIFACIHIIRRLSSIIVIASHSWQHQFLAAYIHLNKYMVLSLLSAWAMIYLAHVGIHERRDDAFRDQCYHPGEMITFLIVLI